MARDRTQFRRAGPHLVQHAADRRNHAIDLIVAGGVGQRDFAAARRRRRSDIEEMIIVAAALGGDRIVLGQQPVRRIAGGSEIDLGRIEIEAVDDRHAILVRGDRGHKRGRAGLGRTARQPVLAGKAGRLHHRAELFLELVDLIVQRALVRALCLGHDQLGLDVLDEFRRLVHAEACRIGGRSAELRRVGRCRHRHAGRLHCLGDGPVGGIVGRLIHLVAVRHDPLLVFQRLRRSGQQRQSAGCTAIV